MNMAWVTPKTDWTADDYISYVDYNRISGNLLHIRDMAQSLFAAFDVNVTPTDRTKDNLPYVTLYNKVEENLEIINSHTYNFDVGETKTYQVNQPYIDYIELNRLEQWTLKIYKSLKCQKDIKRHLPFRLGSGREFDVIRA